MSSLETNAVIENALERIGRDFVQLSERRSRRRRRLQSLAAAVTAALAIGAGASLAASHWWIGHDVTPGEIERQATVVTNDPTLQCGPSGCTQTNQTHREVQVLPSMGVTFVLPSGQTMNIVPAAAAGPAMPHSVAAATDGLSKPDPSGQIPGTIHFGATGGTWIINLGSGVKREIDWRFADGSMSVTDTQADGAATVTNLHAGDVIPLIPSTLDAGARTAEKAVAFDLPDGGRVFIFPTFNEAYVGQLPGAPVPKQELAAGDAVRYGLKTDKNGRAVLPVATGGGTWKLNLPAGGERSIEWQAGDDYVTITDSSIGSTQTNVKIGHELALLP